MLLKIFVVQMWKQIFLFAEVKILSKKTYCIFYFIIYLLYTEHIRIVHQCEHNLTGGFKKIEKRKESFI